MSRDESPRDPASEAKDETRNEAQPSEARKTSSLQKLLPWAITLACFAYLYFQIDAQAERQGQSAIPFLLGVFANVSWASWLALMIPYSAFFFLVDSLVVWRIVNWFNTKVPYTHILPIRGSAYIISILNEQIGKGVMAVYLNRRDGVPGWQVGSSMLFIMFCEFFYLLFWANVGYALRGDRLPEIFAWIPWVGVGAAAFFALWLLYFRGVIAPGHGLRDRQILHAFRQAQWWQYLVVVALRSPALLAAVGVYTLALRLFGLEAQWLDMLGYLPIIFFGAAVPGPFRAVAIALWSFIYADNPGQATAFGLVQHNFFIFFNAAIGMLFLRRANRELFGQARTT
jgi:hypothetical protein